MSQNRELVREFRDIVDIAAKAQVRNPQSRQVEPVRFRNFDRTRSMWIGTDFNIFRRQYGGAIILRSHGGVVDTLQREVNVKSPWMSHLVRIATSRTLDTVEDLQLAVEYARSPHLNAEALQALGVLTVEEEASQAEQLADANQKLQAYNDERAMQAAAREEFRAAHLKHHPIRPILLR